MLFFCWSVCCVCFGASEVQLWINWERRSGVSSSSVEPLSSWSWIVLVSVVCSCCWMGGRSRGDGDRGSCCLLESSAYEVAYHRDPFRAILCRGEPGRVALEVVGLCWFWLVVVMRQGRLPITWPVFLVSGTFSVWLTSLDSSSKQALSSDLRGGGWQFFFASFQYTPLCLRIHDVIPFAANKSSALCGSRTM